MDGFTSIPIQSAGVTTPNVSAQPVPVGFSTAPYKDNAVASNDGIEILSDTTQKIGKTSFVIVFRFS
jgi:hypothetical protein